MKLNKHHKNYRMLNLAWKHHGVEGHHGYLI